MIEKNTYVKVLFRNGVQVEGCVEKWDSNEAILLAEDEQSRFHIFDIKQDVLGVKIYLTEITPKQITKKFEQVVEEFNSVKKSPSDDLRLKRLADLRILMNEQEKKIITGKMKSHHVPEVRPPQYGYPSFLKVTRVK